MVEQMWINVIAFDGDYMKGYLINEPNEFNIVKVVNYFEIPLNEINDLLFAITPAQKKPKRI